MKKMTKREVIKNIAIVFLVIMLILTFFSNTIMNRSLPEVSTQYVTSGTITTQVRGEGIVKADDPYSVIIDETRKIQSVLVKEGDKIEAGDVIVKLEGEEGTELTTAKNDLSILQSEFDIAMLDSGLTNSQIEEIKSGVTITTGNILVALEQKDAEIASAQKTVDDYDKQIKDIEKKLALTEYSSLDDSSEKAAVAAAQAEYDDAVGILGKFDEFNSKCSDYVSADNSFKLWEEKYLNADPLSADYAAIEASYTEALTAKNEAEHEKNMAYLSVPTDISYEQAKENVNGKKATLDAANKALSDKKASFDGQDDVLNRQKIELEQAKAPYDAKLKQLQDERTKYFDTEKSKIDIEKKYQAILKQEATIKDLEAKAAGKEIVSPMTGTVMNVNLAAGESTAPGEAVATILPEGKGYTLSYSVTDKQARSINIGDPVTVVNSWFYYDVTANLVAIQPDRENKRNGKKLVFSISGESVTEGQSLTLSVGEKSAEYDFVVPVSAVKEDNQSKFILIVKTRSTPFGSRYIAERVDVEELARDDNYAAIKAPLYGYEYVITTSSKPLENGDQVKLAE